ncbi:hypothetical protein [uncultured Zoogloea sp.]|uniref:hypothetical protein n=1 Tax=uncultured Zoogloea sp. TaxID=160237 RepID=UPI00261AA2F2|nr:hypothetical protein [uncultured Zoogloea sp.]
MNNTIITLAIAFAAVSAQAADTRAAAATVTKALTCEIADGKAAAVVKAVKALGAKPGKDENDYVLASPITVFGLDVTRINVTPGDDEGGPDSYVAIFANAKPADIATAAQLKPLAGGFVRDTKTGRLAADVRDRTDVWLSCTPTKK